MVSDLAEICFSCRVNRGNVIVSNKTKCVNTHTHTPQYQQHQQGNAMLQKGGFLNLKPDTTQFLNHHLSSPPKTEL